MMSVVENRARVALRRRAYEESKRRLRVGMCGSYSSIPKCTARAVTDVLCPLRTCTALTTEYEELQQVASSNQRRDDRLAKVRGKDFSVKLEQMEVSTRDGERERESMCYLVHRMSVCSRGRR